MIGFGKGYFRLAVQSLRAARIRSLMTMSGIVICVLAVVVISAVSEGVRQQIGNQAARYGKDVLVVRPDSGIGLFDASSLAGGSSVRLSSADMQLIQSIPNVSKVVPLSVLKGTVEADRSIDNPLVIATSSDLGDVLNQEVTYGGFFAPADGEHVVVLGGDVAHQLFSDTAPLGQKLTFRGQEFVVAGVFKPFVAAPFSLEANYNQAIFVPYVAAQNILGDLPQIDQLFVKASPGSDVGALASQIDIKLREAHGGAHDVSVLPPGSRAGTSSNRMLQLLSVMTICLAAVALTLGGVGIMNMMLVSVAERIHEIGLRKAIGASSQQIVRQFLAEALVLCLAGAAIGIALSFGLIGLLRLYTSLQPVIVWQAALFAPLLAILTGVIFGTLPAIKAARMNPIEAIRHE